MDISAIKFFKKLKEIPENTKCFDCGKEDPRWASINHGTIICLLCSGTHRAFGVHISCTRSLMMDSWSESQMHTMSIGGNARAYEFFEAEEIMDLDVSQRYYTNAAKYYRSVLSARSSSMSIPDKPYEEGKGAELVLEDIPKTNENGQGRSKTSGLGSDPSASSSSHHAPSGGPHMNIPDMDTVIKTASGVFNSAVQTASDTANTLKDTINQGDIINKTQEFAHNALSTITDQNTAQQVESKVSDLSNQGWGLFNSALRYSQAAFGEASKVANDVVNNGFEGERVMDSIMKLPSKVVESVSNVESVTTTTTNTNTTENNGPNNENRATSV